MAFSVPLCDNPSALCVEGLDFRYHKSMADPKARRIGLSRLESAQLVEMVIDEISDAILRGENVKLSSFGTFLQRSKRERIGRNPKTGVEATITPRKVLIFKASHIMRERINGD